MGCFLACFRVKEDEQPKAHLKSRLIPFKRKRSSKQLAPVPKCEEIGPPCNAESSDTEHLHEVKFLKGCGAVSETPAEIHKEFEKVITPSLDEDDLSSNFHSWFPCTSSKKLLCNEQHSQLSMSQMQRHDSSLPENNSACYNLEGIQGIQHSGNTSPSDTPSKPMDFAGSRHNSGAEIGLKSVTLDLSPNQTIGVIRSLDSSHSPYPTPLNLTDEMQTPLTIYSTNLENPRTRKNARGRTQYVYPVLNSVENLSQWKLLRENSSQIGQSVDSFKRQRCSSPEVREHSGKFQRLSPTSIHKGSLRPSIPNDTTEIMSPNMVAPTSRSKVKVLLSLENSQLELNLSQSLTPVPADDMRGWNCESVIAEEDAHCKKTPDGDNPSFGFITTHLDNGPCMSPKWWDTNGIPNTTSKYKEDQKVTWHTTPFEQRLEKVLSIDKLLPQRTLNEEKPIMIKDGGNGSDMVAY